MTTNCTAGNNIGYTGL